MSTIGRPLKKGLDYFAHSVKHTDEENILFRKYGCNGYTVYYVLREKIAENGYYYEMNESKRILLCSKYNLDETMFLEIINFAVKLKLFDKTIFETYQVLTNENLQIDYIVAASRRKKIDFFEEYYLINNYTLLCEIAEPKTCEKITIYSIYADNKSLSVNNNSLSADKKALFAEKPSYSREEYSKRESILKEKEKKKQPVLAQSVGKEYEKESAERENKGKPILDIIAMPNEEFEQKYMN